ncbi:MAG: hypothetical protein IPM91_06415 [Bacteroidetes bacterium]|nr:hypothetical protein [Bacteroidota bacterium]
MRIGCRCTYQWFKGSVINGATQSSYAATTAGSYSVRVTASGCSATSSPLVLTSSSGPVATITSSGYPQICSGESLTLKAPSTAGFLINGKRTMPIFQVPPIQYMLPPQPVRIR